MCPVFLKFSLFWSLVISTSAEITQHLAQRVLWEKNTSQRAQQFMVVLRELLKTQARVDLSGIRDSQPVTVGRREQDSEALMRDGGAGHPVRSWRTFSPM